MQELWRPEASPSPQDRPDGVGERRGALIPGIFHGTSGKVSFVCAKALTDTFMQCREGETGTGQAAG